MSNLDITLESKILIAALKRLKPAISKRSSALPVLSGVHITVVNGQARLSTSNLDVTLSLDLPAQVGSDGITVIPFVELLRYVEAKKTGPLRILDDGHTTVLEHGKSTFSLKRLDANNYPKLYEPKGRAVPLNLAALRDVFPAASKDGTRPILCSVLVDDGEYAATDSYRLYIASTKVDTGAAFLIPVDLVTELIKLKTVVDVVATVDERNITVTLDDGFRLTGRLIDGTFPNYKTLVPSSVPLAIEFDDTAELVAAIKLVDKVCPDLSAPVRIGPAEEPGFLLVSKYGQDFGTLNELVRGTAPLQAAFNPGFLADLLTGTNAGYIGGTDTLKPWIVEEPAPNVSSIATRKRLIMPVRVSG